MFAEQKEPQTFKEKRKTVAMKPNILDQERALIMEENIQMNQVAERAKLVGEVGGGSGQAFKVSAEARV